MPKVTRFPFYVKTTGTCTPVRNGGGEAKWQRHGAGRPVPITHIAMLARLNRDLYGRAEAYRFQYYA